MHPGIQYSSITRITIMNIRDNKTIYAHNYSCTTVYFERITVLLGHFPEASCARHLLVTRASFQRK